MREAYPDGPEYIAVVYVISLVSPIYKLPSTPGRKDAATGLYSNPSNGTL